MGGGGCATLAAVGVIDDGRSSARFLATVLCAPWQAVPFVFLALVPIEEYVLGYSFWAESPPGLFEPLWLAFCLLAGLVNAALVSALARAARKRLPRRMGALLPPVLTGLWIAVGVAFVLADT
jgi:hypothetical protein